MVAMNPELHRRVLGELESEPVFADQEISISVQDDVVSLCGYVDSNEKKYLVEQLVARVKGVRAVAVDLHVRPPGPHEITDTDIGHAVAGHLRGLDVPAGAVWAKVEGRWVTLEGEVELFCQKAAAEEGLANLPGVRGVINWIRVEPPENVTDIQSKIETALIRRLYDEPRRGRSARGAQTDPVVRRRPCRPSR